VPITQDGKVVDSQGYILDLEDEWTKPGIDAEGPQKPSGCHNGLRGPQIGQLPK
jgi:hypothetical protein